MSAPFKPSRPDGRSDRQVIYDLTRQSEPETLFSFDDLISALAADVDRPIGRPQVYEAVAEANRILRREERRMLAVVKNVGYRMLRADEHLPLAVIRQERAEAHIRTGIEILRQVRWDEMDQVRRAETQGMLLIMNGFYQHMQAQDRRLARLEAAMKSTERRVNSLEGSKDAGA